MTLRTDGTKAVDAVPQWNLGPEGCDNIARDIAPTPRESNENVVARPFVHNYKMPYVHLGHKYSSDNLQAIYSETSAEGGMGMLPHSNLGGPWERQEDVVARPFVHNYRAPYVHCGHKYSSENLQAIYSETSSEGGMGMLPHSDLGGLW
eukprot:CAMPEP_0197443240 /NCGR_PEP_ID=MMETSP1175-20131217/9026_1 /TAXON_ID=1003142 /ORGANISM="Triceratium dubium, Strain CCMP147" /LENGTH=148 /DNA_ID=CAMNT_0042973841 /DNA_START=221 /DNA_END=667 /DNA_ORIENTATION=-